MSTKSTSSQSKRTSATIITRKSPDSKTYSFALTRNWILSISELRFYGAKFKAMTTERMASKSNWRTRRSKFRGVKGKSARLWSLSKTPNTLWPSLMQNLVTWRIKITNTQTLRLNFLKLTSMNMYRAKKILWGSRSWPSTCRNASRMNLLWCMS